MKILTLAAALAVATLPSYAHADACGDDYYLVVENLEVDISPEKPCLVVTSQGSSQPGCDQIEIVIENTCADALTVEMPEEEWLCGAEYPVDPATATAACGSLEPGHFMVFPVSASSPSHQGFGFSAEDSAGGVMIQVAFEVVEGEAGDNGGGGCSSAPATPGGGALAALAGALAWLARRRRR
jgi:uncharacterized protein (TIGR03382 family)